MADEGELTAVVDRIVGDRAVLLVGEEEQEAVVPVADLPRGTGEGGWVQVRVRAETAVEVVGPAEPAVDEAALESRVEALRRRSRRFKR
jgi:hypothetical protein